MCRPVPLKTASFLDHGIFHILLFCNVRTVASGGLSFLLGVWLLLHGLHATLVRLALLVRSEVGIRLKPFRTFDTVKVAKRWEFLGSLGFVVLFQMAFVVNVGVNLVEVARVTAGLLLGVDSTNSRHFGGEASRVVFILSALLE